MYTSSRGASIFAAVAFVAVLGFTLIGIEALSPTNPNSQTAAPAPAVPSVASEVAAAKKTQSEACTIQMRAATKTGTGASPVTTQTITKNTTEENVCVGAILKSPDAKMTEASSYKCVGELTTIKLDKATGQKTITSSADTTNNPPTDEGKCKVTFCDADGKHCSDASTPWNGTDSLQRFALSGNTLANLPPDQKSAVLANLSAVDSNDQKALSSLLADGQKTAAQDTKTLMDAANSCSISEKCNVNAQIAQLANANGASCTQVSNETGNYSCSPQDLQGAFKNAQLSQKQLDSLAAAQVPLTPTYAGPCSSGQSVNSSTGTCDAPTPACTGANCGGGNSNTFGGGSGLGGLSSLLSGLGKGLSGSGSQTPPPPAPAQTCSTDSATYQQQQQQYQQQLQQYNYQLQQYNYQLQLNSQYGQSSAQPIPPQQPTPCSPSTQNQCSTQPQQPAASTCTGGTWQPVYSGNCIARWQCGGSNAGTATLSCQPQTADVGMSIAISYSCSVGTATGQGFTASGQSGTSTAVVAAPPDGTNTATYTLKCDSNGQTAGAQCSVQVAAPSIVLVANPKTVKSGGTSQIGWITSGMQSCVISSPDQSDFTAQNTANTSVSGTATTMPITTSAGFALHCKTVAGGTRDATTTVSIQD